MEKRLIDRFTEDFEKELSPDLPREESFKRAKERFEKVCGFTPYRSWNSYASARIQDRRKRRIR